MVCIAVCRKGREMVIGLKGDGCRFQGHSFCAEGEFETVHSPHMIMLTNLCTIAEAPCARTTSPSVAQQAALA